MGITNEHPQGEKPVQERPPVQFSRYHWSRSLSISSDELIVDRNCTARLQKTTGGFYVEALKWDSNNDLDSRAHLVAFCKFPDASDAEYWVERINENSSEFAFPAKPREILFKDVTPRTHTASADDGLSL